MGTLWRIGRRIPYHLLGVISYPSNNSVTDKSHGFSFPFEGGETVLVYRFFLLLLIWLYDSSNMDKVLRNWNHLSLTENKGARVNLESDSDAATTEFILATRFLTRRVLNVKAISRTFKPLWKAQNGFHI